MTEDRMAVGRRLHNLDRLMRDTDGARREEFREKMRDEVRSRLD